MLKKNSFKKFLNPDPDPAAVQNLTVSFRVQRHITGKTVTNIRSVVLTLKLLTDKQIAK